MWTLGKQAEPQAGMTHCQRNGHGDLHTSKYEGLWIAQRSRFEDVWERGLLRENRAGEERRLGTFTNQATTLTGK